MEEDFDLTPQPPSGESERDRARDRPAGAPLLLWLLAASGLVFGLTGIYLGNAGQAAAAEAQRQLASQPDLAGSLEPRLAALSAELDALEKALEATQTRQVEGDRKLFNDTKNALDSLYRDIRANREKVNELTDMVAGLPTRPVSAAPSPARPPAATGTPASAAGAPAGQARPTTYTIAAGDTFAKLAPRFGVSVSDLLAANPGVDPNRLQIGQVINLPPQ